MLKGANSMKGKDYNINIDILDEELDRLQEMMTGMDPLSDDYDKLCDRIKKIQESKLLEHKCYSEHKEHLVPEAFPKVLSTVVSGLLIHKIYSGEKAGMVISSAATTLLGKLRLQ